MKIILLYVGLIFCIVPLRAMEEMAQKQKTICKKPPELPRAHLKPKEHEFALMNAWKEDNFKKMKEIHTQHGSEVNIDEQLNGVTVLSYAFLNGHQDAEALLLEQRADVNT